MTRPIRKGDKVAVCLSASSSLRVKGVFVVESTPCATGDLWYLRGGDGKVLALNPNSADFIGLVAMPTAPRQVH